MKIVISAVFNVSNTIVLNANKIIIYKMVNAIWPAFYVKYLYRR